MVWEWDKVVVGNVLFFEMLFVVEIEQVDNECSVSYFIIQMMDQFNGCFDSVVGCQQVVYYQNFVVWFDGINVDFQLIGVVFQVVSFIDGFMRQFVWFMDWYKVNVQIQSYWSVK